MNWCVYSALRDCQNLHRDRLSDWLAIGYYGYDLIAFTLLLILLTTTTNYYYYFYYFYYWLPLPLLLSLPVAVAVFSNSAEKQWYYKRISIRFLSRFSCIIHNLYFMIFYVYDLIIAKNKPFTRLLTVVPRLLRDWLSDWGLSGKRYFGQPPYRVPE